MKLKRHREGVQQSDSARIRLLRDKGGHVLPSGGFGGSTLIRFALLLLLLTTAAQAEVRDVAFLSDATNLVPGDTNGLGDIFVFEGLTGEVERVNVAGDGSQANAVSFKPSISDDGRFVAFDSMASNLVSGDTNGWMDVFVHDRVTGETTRVRPPEGPFPGACYQGRISADGRTVVFTTRDPSYSYPYPTVYLYDRFTGSTQRVELGQRPAVSADGRFVAFDSPDSIVPEDTGQINDVFVWDRQTGEVTRVSVSSSGEQANSDSYQASLSAEGRHVSFGSWASNLVLGDSSLFKVFVHDRESGETTRVSAAPDGAAPDYYALGASISADGRFVAYESAASNLVPGDGNFASDVFLYDRETRHTARVSVAGQGTEANGESGGAALSAHGRFVAFSSAASNLVQEDNNGSGDVFVRDLQTGETRRVRGAFVPEEPDAGSGQPEIIASDQPSPIARAGEDQMLTDEDGDGVEPVTLDGSASSDNGLLVSWGWTQDGLLIGSGPVVGVGMTVGVHAIELKVTDDEGAWSIDTLVVTVLPRPNSPPVAQNDEASTPEGTCVTIPVLANDFDPDGDTLRVTSVSDPLVTIGEGGLLTYIPPPGFVGAAVFTYVVEDGWGATASATVTVEVISLRVNLLFQDGVSPDGAYQGTRDVYISRQRPPLNHGGEERCLVAERASCLLRWDVAAIPRGSIVESASIILVVADPSDDDYPIYEMKQDWTEGTGVEEDPRRDGATWLRYDGMNRWQQPGATGASDRGSSPLGSLIATDEPGVLQIELNALGLELLQRWVDQPEQNRGIIFQSDLNSDTLEFWTREHAQPKERPALVVVYRRPAPW